MKKSSIFILVVTFLLSIFLVSFYGLQIRDEHMKRYFTKAEILDAQVIEFEGEKLKYIIYDFDKQKAPSSLYIEYSVTPEDVTDSEGYEFIITSGNGTFIEDEIEYPFAEITKNRVTFYKACDITVMLRTTDGSGLSDSVIIFCNDITDVEDD